MRLPQRLTYRIYFFFIAWIVLTDLFVLITPDSEGYVYYHTMEALLPPAVMFYRYALLSAVVNIICLGALFAYAFNWKPAGGWFWRPLFLTRIATDVLGHNFELQALKSAFHAERGLLVTTLVVYAFLLIPSYYAHYCHAFRKTEKNSPSGAVLASD